MGRSAELRLTRDKAAHTQKTVVRFEQEVMLKQFLPQVLQGHLPCVEQESNKSIVILNRIELYNSTKRRVLTLNLNYCLSGSLISFECHFMGGQSK